jgi:signal transduction histidine kinase
VRKLAYISLLALALVLGIVTGWSNFGQQIDSDAYDFFFRLYQPKPPAPESIVLAADEESFRAYGGLFKLRQALAAGLNRIRDAHPRAVALDVVLSEASDNPVIDAALEDAFRHTPNLVLPSFLVDAGGRWDDPLPRFRQYAVALGEVHAQPDTRDAIMREIPLDRVAGRERHWALAVEAFRVSRHADIVQTLNTVQMDGVSIPASIDKPMMRVNYVPGGVPHVSLKQLADNPALAERFRDKVVFAGVTAQAMGDRWMTPLSNSVNVPGIEIHANAFETIAHQRFLTDAPRLWVVLICLAFVAAAGITFSLLDGWPANLAAAGILIAAHVLPYVFFTHRTVFPYTPGAACAWLAIVIAAAWRHIVVRRLLGKSETARADYRQAMQFVTHEMKTPLTAIQGSSELISRYAMTDEKRKQMADMINAESKRLAQMIETFLNVERLSAGQMQLKKESFSPFDVVSRCIERVRPVADRKAIAIQMETLPDGALTGDRELMEYAFYNLLTNAVKYSPRDTTVTVSGERQKDRVRVSVVDQGIGIDAKDARRIFEKFYRTKTAEQSGEKGTGIGLSIVEQIVIRHGGSISVDSEVGKGSRFTISLPTA